VKRFRNVDFPYGRLQVTQSPWPIGMQPSRRLPGPRTQVPRYPAAKSRFGTLGPVVHPGSLQPEPWQPMQTLPKYGTLPRLPGTKLPITLFSRNSGGWVRRARP
jgi:hypothetical protein